MGNGVKPIDINAFRLEMPEAPTNAETAMRNMRTSIRVADCFDYCGSRGIALYADKLVKACRHNWRIARDSGIAESESLDVSRLLRSARNLAMEGRNRSTIDEVIRSVREIALDARNHMDGYEESTMARITRFGSSNFQPFSHQFNVEVLLRGRNLALDKMAKTGARLNRVEVNAAELEAELDFVRELRIPSFQSSSRAVSEVMTSYGAIVLFAVLPDAIEGTYNYFTNREMPEETRSITNNSILSAALLMMTKSYTSSGFSPSRALVIAAARFTLAAAGIETISDPLETACEWMGIEIPETGINRTLFNINGATLYLIAEHLAWRGIQSLWMRISVAGLIKAIGGTALRASLLEALPIIIGGAAIAAGLGIMILREFKDRLENDESFRNRVALLLDEGRDGDITIEDLERALPYVIDKAEALEGELQMAERDINNQI